MKAILVVEDEPRPLVQLEAVITAVDPKILIKKFSSLEDFSFWIEKAYINPIMPSPDGSLSNAPEDADAREAARDSTRIEEIVLLIANHRLIPPSKIKLVEKINRFFRAKKLIGERPKVGFLFLAHETDELDLSEFAHPPYDNIIFKPIDRDVTKEKILWAMDPESASQGEGLHKEKPHSEVEMLKEIIIDRVTSYGIATVSDREVKVGTLGRYYCPTASDTLRKGFYARCYDCIPHPERPGSFRVFFTFFGFSSINISAHRKGLSKHEKMQQTHLRAPGTDEKISVIIVDEEPATREYLESELADQFVNITTTSYTSLVDFLLDIDPNQAAAEAYADVEDEASFFKPVTFIYDKKGQTLLEVQYDEEQKEPLGMERTELSRAKTLFLSKISSEQKEQFLSYWKGDSDKAFTFIYKTETESLFYTIVRSELLQGDKDSTRLIEIRFATADEVKTTQRDNARIKPNLALIFVSHKFAARRGPEFWNTAMAQLKEQNFLKKGLESPHICVISREALDSHEASKQLLYFDDLFFSPFDSSYLHGKLKHFVPDLKVSRDPINYYFVDHELPAFSSNVADVKSISEVAIAINYPRSLVLDTYRYFVVRFPGEEEQPRLLAKNVLIQPAEKKEEGNLHHFVFFGLSEHYNFMLRNWLMEQYTLTKQEEEKAQNESN